MDVSERYPNAESGNASNFRGNSWCGIVWFGESLIRIHSGLRRVRTPSLSSTQWAWSMNIGISQSLSHIRRFQFETLIPANKFRKNGTNYFSNWTESIISMSKFNISNKTKTPNSSREDCTRSVRSPVS